MSYHLSIITPSRDSSMRVIVSPTQKSRLSLVISVLLVARGELVDQLASEALSDDVEAHSGELGHVVLVAHDLARVLVVTRKVGELDPPSVRVHVGCIVCDL